MFRIGNDVIALVTDAACDLSDELLMQYDVRIIPLRVLTSTGAYRDACEISLQEAYALMHSEHPRTALPLPEDVSAVYRQLQQEGATRILHLCISGSLSGACNMAATMANEIPGLTVDVFDSNTLSGGLGLLVLDAAENLARGMTAEAVLQRLTKLRKHQLSAFVVRKPSIMHKGGRVGLAEGVLARLLNSKPVFFINDDGHVAVQAKGGSFNRALSLMQEEFFRRYQGRQVRVAIVHGDVESEASALLDAFCDHLDVVSGIICPISPALALHTGPGLLGAIVQYTE